MLLRQLFDPATISSDTFLLADETTHDALLIDASVDDGIRRAFRR